MPSNKERRATRPNNNSPRPVSISSGSPASSSPDDVPLPGVLGWMARNRGLLGWLELLAAVILVALAFSGFLGGAVFLPFGFGLLGLRFFYAYVQHSLGISFGKIGLVLNIVLLAGALACIVLGLLNESNQ